MKCFVALVALAFASFGCAPPVNSVTDSGTNQNLILTTFYPTTYFAERIAEGLLAVECPVPEGSDPIYWQPSRSAIQRYQSAGLIILNGASFEKWTSAVNFPLSRVIESAQLSHEELITYQSFIEHRHGPSGGHSHEGIDGHTWIDPINAKAQSQNILNAMRDRWPEHGLAFMESHAELAADLETLNVRLGALSVPAVLASHPAYNYLARRYGWDIRNLDLNPESVISEDQIKAIETSLKQRPAHWLLWESEPLPETAALLEKQLGVRSIVFSPCELISAKERKEGADYLSLMSENISRLEKVFSNNSPK